jgi:hypothetical protein
MHSYFFAEKKWQRYQNKQYIHQIIICILTFLMKRNGNGINLYIYNYMCVKLDLYYYYYHSLFSYSCATKMFLFYIEKQTKIKFV